MIISALYTARAQRGSSDKVYTIEDAETVMNDIKMSRPEKRPENVRRPFSGRSDGIVEMSHNLSSQSITLQDMRENYCKNENEQFKIDTIQLEDVQVEERQNAKEDEQVLFEYEDHDNIVFTALLEACRAAGYDDSHDQRKSLVKILTGVADGNSFPDDILLIVEAKTNLSTVLLDRILRPQIHIVLEGMQNAVQAEEQRLAEMERLEE